MKTLVSLLLTLLAAPFVVVAFVLGLGCVVRCAAFGRHRRIVCVAAFLLLLPSAPASDIALVCAATAPEPDGASAANVNTAIAALLGASAMFAALSIVRRGLGIKEAPAERKIVEGNLTTRSEIEFATVASVTKLERQVAELSAQFRSLEHHLTDVMNGRFDKLDHERSVSIARLHERVTDTADALRREIHEMPAQIIELLKNTGHLNKPEAGGRAR